MSDDSGAPLFLIASIRPLPERMTEAEAALRDLVAGTRAEEGNVFMELVVADDDPTTWLMLEKFRSRADWDAHMRSAHVERGNRNLADLLREPTELRFYGPK